MGISTIGIGGDPIIGTTTKERWTFFERPETDGIIMIGEIESIRVARC